MKPSQHKLFVAQVAMMLPLGLMAWVPRAAAKGIEPRVEKLDNGLTLLLVERHEQPTVAAGIFYDVGSVNDPAGKSGIAHLFEHMLFKGSRVIGTSNYQAERPLIKKQDELREKMIAEMTRMRLMKRRGEIDDVLDPKQWTPAYTAMKVKYDKLLDELRQHAKNNELADLYSENGGAGMNAGTSDDFTMYFVVLPANKLELFFWLESDRMVNGVMREFYVELKNVREERRLRTESTPTGRYDEAFNALFWQSHPYGVPTLGWASEVESITRQDVRDFYRLHYAPNNATLVLVGDFSTDHVKTLASQYFGPIKRMEQQPPPVVTEEPAPIAERRFYAEAETNPRVRVRYHGVAIGHKDEAALEVLGSLLSGKTGRLYKRLVAKEEAALGQPRASNRSRKYAGFFEINVTVKDGRTPEEVEAMILEEVDKLREGEITDHELQKVKNQVLASSVRRLKNDTGLMFQLGIYQTWYEWSYINESPERMLRITAHDVRSVVKKYFDPKTRTVAIYKTKEGPASEQDPDLAAALASVPAETHDMVKSMVKKIKSIQDMGKLTMQLSMMEQGLASGKAPEAERPMIEYMLKVVKDRVAELEAAEREGN